MARQDPSTISSSSRRLTPTFWRGMLGVVMGFGLINGASRPGVTELAPGTLASGSLDFQLVTPHPTQLVPDYPSFNSQRLDQQLQLYRQYLATYGTPDVLIVGSSRSLQGIDPDVLGEALAAQGYGDVQIYNFSINGATAQVIDLVLRQLLTVEQLPQLILWGDGSRAFNNGRLDVTFNGIVASEGYQQLQTGTFPIVTPNPLPMSALSPELCLELPDRSLMAQKSPHLKSRTLPICNSPESRPLPIPSPVAVSSAVPLQRIGDLEISGFRRVLDQFDPTMYYQTYPVVPGNYDSDYVPFRLEGVQTEAAIALSRYTQSHRIPLVFVNLPLTQSYLDSTRQSYEQQFRQHMQRLAIQEGFIFRNLVGQWTTQNHYFADPSHLNAQGARAVALYLATDSAIPWSRLNPVE